MRGYISSTNWAEVFQEKDPDRACTKVTDIICTAMEMFIPSKTIVKKPGDKAWFDENCRSAAKKKRHLFRQLKQHGSAANKEKFSQARQSYNQAENQAKFNYSKQLREDLADNSLSCKKWWRIVNSLSGRAAYSTVPVILQNDVAHITSRDKAGVFCKTFADKCKLNDASQSPPHVEKCTPLSITNITFKPKDIHKLLMQLQPDKATGPDHIPARVLKECSAELASPLCRLFSLCFASGILHFIYKKKSLMFSLML